MMNNISSEMLKELKENCEIGNRNLARGALVVFEGGDGTGKTTHRERIANILDARGYEVVCVREPGGTKIGEELRDILLDPENKQMSAECELLLYVAARAQIVREVIVPALRCGALVLCDRFTMSTLAYQGYGRGLDKNFIRMANEFAVAGVKPDCTFLLQCGGADVALARALEASEGDDSGDFDGRGDFDGSGNDEQKHTSSSSIDRIESAGQSFHERVCNAYFEIAQSMSKCESKGENEQKSKCESACMGENIYIIDTSQEKDEVTLQILEHIDKMLLQLRRESC